MTALAEEQISAPSLNELSVAGRLFRFATPRTPARPSYGPAVITIAAILGKPLMPWQAYVVMVALEVDAETGEWAYSTVVVTVPRQAGKTVILQPVFAHRAGAGHGVRIWQTAQSGRKARKRWMDLTTALVESPLRSKVRRKVGVGHEELRWRVEDSTIEPFSPNDTDMHGETPDLIGVDELWAYDADKAEAVQGAYLPGFTTKDGQAWLLSTAGTAASAWLNTERRQGRAAVAAGVVEGTAYFECSIPEEVNGIKVEDLDDESALQLVLEHHPARGHTLREKSVRDAMRKMPSRSEFLRAYGNHAGDVAEPSLIDPGAFRRAMAGELIPEGVPVGFAFEVDPERRSASVSAGWRDPETGRAVVELIEHRPGTRWLAGYMAGRIETYEPGVVAVNDAGPARDVADQLEQAGFELLRVNMRDYGAACVRWFEETTHTDESGRPAPTCLHDGHPDLEEAVRAARWRISGTSRMFASSDEPITPLVSNTVALWAADHLPEPEVDLGPFKMR